MSTKSYAAQSVTSRLKSFVLNRCAPQPANVEIDILFCGVCHSDWKLFTHH